MEPTPFPHAQYTQLEWSSILVWVFHQREEKVVRHALASSLRKREERKRLCLQRGITVTAATSHNGVQPIQSVLQADGRIRSCPKVAEFKRNRRSQRRQEKRLVKIRPALMKV